LGRGVTYKYPHEFFQNDWVQNSKYLPDKKLETRNTIIQKEKRPDRKLRLKQQ